MKFTAEHEMFRQRAALRAKKSIRMWTSGRSGHLARPRVLQEDG